MAVCCHSVYVGVAQLTSHLSCSNTTRSVSEHNSDKRTRLKALISYVYHKYSANSGGKTFDKFDGTNVICQYFTSQILK